MPDILARRDGSCLILTLENEPRRNAFTHAMTLRLGELLDEAEGDRSVRAVVITGAGKKAFSSGHDLNDMLADRQSASDPTLNEPFVKPQKMTTPTLAVVNGHAHAAGFILSLACDARICEPHADFATPGARIGLLPIGGQISRLPSLIPLGIVFELLATGRRLGAEEALRLGFVNAVSAPGEGLKTGLQLAASLAANSSEVIAGIKTGLNIFCREGEQAAERFEWEEGRRLQSGPDAEEGIRAFLEKRQPNFA